MKKAVLGLLASFIVLSAEASAYVYIVDNPAGPGTVIALDEDTLLPIPGSPFQDVPEIGGGQVMLAISPDGTRLYVPAFQLADKVAVFDVSSTTGVLTPIPGSPFSDAQNPLYTFMQPFGAAVSTQGYVYITNSQETAPASNLYRIYKLDRDFNYLTHVDTNGASLKTASAIAINRAGTRVYVTFSDTSNIALFDENLNFITSQSNGTSSTYGVALHPDETYVYTTNVGGQVTRFDPDLSNPLMVSPPGIINAVGIAVDPDGSRLYIADLANFVYVLDSVSLATITVLSSQGVSPYLLGIDPAGERLYTANAADGFLSVRDLDQNTYPPIASSPFLIGTSIFGIAFTPQLASPPRNLTGQQKKNDFGLVYERFNLLQWETPSTGQPAGYFVYRNEIKIATLDSSALEYQDHNRPKGVPTFYSVSSFDANGNESDPIDIEVQ